MSYCNGVVTTVDIPNTRVPPFCFGMLTRNTVNFTPSISTTIFFTRITTNDLKLDLFGAIRYYHGVAFQDETTKTYPKYEYCVKYQEPDLDFVTRLVTVIDRSCASTEVLANISTLAPRKIFIFTLKVLVFVFMVRILLLETLF